MPGDSDESLRQAKLSDLVYERIFEAIVSGDYPTNARLPSEVELAERYKVSRPVVREALARLRDDQVIISRQGSGSFVQRRPDSSTIGFGPLGSIADMQRCFEFREAIEGYTAGLAAERRSEEDAEGLVALIAELREAVSRGTLGAEADFRFHLAVADASRNRFLITALRSVETHAAFGIRLARSLSLARPRARLLEVQAEHEEICAAILAGNADAASAAMLAHLRQARLRVFEGSDGLEG
ncbi:FadR/GntR family transcriptional regulator [Acuticoccus kandeliae]|uniref:FadR/GntR family transcriptional regulator n=1 Tax=Acuticoccus kandeliae TaxID=2073160 RepID=UPI000D3EDF94|nr:FadR/GntR family transcriptional regulator [Acuticoccus kandeliae]